MIIVAFTELANYRSLCDEKVLLIPKLTHTINIVYMFYYIISMVLIIINVKQGIIDMIAIEAICYLYSI